MSCPSDTHCEGRGELCCWCTSKDNTLSVYLCVNKYTYQTPAAVPDYAASYMEKAWLNLDVNCKNHLGSAINLRAVGAIAIVVLSGISSSI